MKSVAIVLVPLSVLLSACGGGESDGSSPVAGGPGAGPPASTPAPAPSPTVSISYLHVFAVDPADGSQPNGPPLQASDGNFYGTTRAGGLQSCRPGNPIPCGVIYRITPNGQQSVLYSFGQTADDGYSPLGALVQGSDGALYGTTSNGGVHLGGGTVFRITLAGAYRTLHSFGGGGDAPFLPVNTLIFGRDGDLYGVTSAGGANRCAQIPRDANNCGTIFRMTTNGIRTTLHSFGRTPTDGYQPNGRLVQTADGSFYGTTLLGGEYDKGTIFRLGVDGSLTIIHSFGATSSDPSNPQGPLTIGSDGHLYGTTPSGGAGRGTVYRLDSAGRVTVIYAFGRDGNADGAGPAPQLTLGSDGLLYGTTRGAGEHLGGTAFRITNSGALTTLFAFGMRTSQGTTMPSDPEQGLIEGRDGALYGTTAQNGGLGGVGNRPGFGAFYRLAIR